MSVPHTQEGWLPQRPGSAMWDPLEVGHLGPSMLLSRRCLSSLSPLHQTGARDDDDGGGGGGGGFFGWFKSK